MVFQLGKSIMYSMQHLLDQNISFLDYESKLISKTYLYPPGPDFIDRVLIDSDRSPIVLRNLNTVFDTGRLAGTGYLSILPVDQGIEHSAAASFMANRIYFDPKNIFELAIEGGCNCIVATYGTIGSVARKYAHKIPIVLKLNHNELLSYPNCADQICFTNAKRAFEMGCVGIGATVYWGSPCSRRQLQEISELFSEAHALGMFTILWCYVRNSEFKKNGVNYELSYDLTGQANYLGANLQADIIKQKLPKIDDGFSAIDFNNQKLIKKNKEFTTMHPIDMVRYQIVNCFMGRVGLISSGGESFGESDLKDAVLSAIINKRAGGMGMIIGRKAFQKEKKDGIALLNAVQDIYLNKSITLA